MWRTLACTVGTRGLRGWKISDSPVARKSSPSPGSARAISGRSVPCTSENPTPAFSNSAPSASTRVRPPPPPRPRPGVLAEAAAAVGGLDRGRDAVLQLQEEVARAIAIGGDWTSAPQLLAPLGVFSVTIRFFDVAEARIALADVLEEVERLAHVAQLLEHRAEQVVELDRLRRGRLRAG